MQSIQNKKEILKSLYPKLFEMYGAQGWWPLLVQKEGQYVSHYRKDQNDCKLTEDERFEVSVGAILTQNTNWKNVEKGLGNLCKYNLLSLKTFGAATEEQIKDAIRCTGYFNQKAKALRCFYQFLQENSFDMLQKNEQMASRDLLLEVKGIGPETADCILLYALDQPSFVVDAYTRRFLIEKKIISNCASYQDIKVLFEDALPLDVTLFKEYHALLVAHAKRFYSKKEYGVNDPLLEVRKI